MFGNKSLKDQEVVEMFRKFNVNLSFSYEGQYCGVAWQIPGKPTDSYEETSSDHTMAQIIDFALGEIQYDLERFESQNTGV